MRAMSRPDRRKELEGWIAESRRLQVRMTLGFAVVAAAALVTLFFNAFLGKMALAILVVTAICAYWVTGSHIADWRTQLAALDQARRKSGGSAPER